ncbi:MAG: Hsp20/alpha crystallin family protein [Planctomycetaceae bacterium]|nr:Hsp20/alpha crystallin family protein [Planctomycetaceae bacterium]
MTTTTPARAIRNLVPASGRDLFQSLRDEMEDLFGRFLTDGGADGVQMIRPSLDLSETDSNVQIRVDVPGMKAEDIDIEVSGNTLRISGQRKEEKEEKGKTWHRVERRSGSFARTVTLPCEVKENQAKAEYADGVLTLSLPKAEEAKTRRIKVEAKAK